MEQGSSAKLTPMMKQFVELKQQYNDCILLFRAGDFYETFYDDSKICAEELGITLTKRGEVPMAGVPYHSINPYIKKLIQRNYKVAICDQLEDPKTAKGLVKRGVTRVITPGTVLEDDYLSSFENNFIMSIYIPKNISEKFGVSLVDISTGEFITTQVDSLNDAKTLIRKYSPNEIILNESNFIRGLRTFIRNNNIYFNYLSEIRFNVNYAREILKKQFKHNQSELGLEGKDFCVMSSGALLFYIYKLQKLDLSHINKITYQNLSSNMILDNVSLRNLEVTNSMFSKDEKKTLFGILNNCKTASGSRLLKSRLVNPSIERARIEEDFDAIDELNEMVIERNEIRDHLSEISDIERITSRITSKIASPRDLNALKVSLSKVPEIKRIMNVFNSKVLRDVRNIDSLREVVTLIESAIIEDAPSHTRDIGYIKSDFNDELKELSDITFNSRDYLKELEESERIRTKINLLKIRYNKIFGYYIEVPKSQVDKIPEDYETKQTLVNATRYIKPELKDLENKILGAEERIKILEQEIFNSILDRLKNYTKNLQKLSRKLSKLDVLISHSLNSQLYNYKRPKFNEAETEIISGRNPIVERFVSDFVSNDTKFDDEEKFQIITGPNMSGKSTYLRQNALIVIMAQAGSFVSAEFANLKMYDRVFTRIGAHDELSEGQSTFMVEMVETANIINNSTENSLVLLDEIGRGTSTYDGLAIAWAVVEKLVEIGCDSIFATHYHQLNQLENFYPKIRNYNVIVREEGDEVEFIRKIERGGTDKSYGVYVGKLAGLPDDVLARAKEVQNNIEEKESVSIKSEFKNSMIKKSKKSSNGQKKRLDEFM